MKKETISLGGRTLFVTEKNGVVEAGREKQQKGGKEKITASKKKNSYNKSWTIPKKRHGGGHDANVYLVNT